MPQPSVSEGISPLPIPMHPCEPPAFTRIRLAEISNPKRSMSSGLRVWMMAVWPRPSLAKIVLHVASPSSSPSTVKSERTGASFSLP